MNVRKILNEIFENDKKTNGLKSRLSSCEPKSRALVLEELFNDILKETTEKSKVNLKAVRLMDILTEINDSTAVSCAIKGMNHKNEDLRVLCGEALLQIIVQNPKKISPAVDEAFKGDNQTAIEMPFLLAETGDPRAFEGIMKFLSHDNPQVVLSAIDVLVEIGDEDSLNAVKSHVDDERIIKADEKNDLDTDVTVGQIATEAIKYFRMEE